MIQITKINQKIKITKSSNIKSKQLNKIKMQTIDKSVLTKCPQLEAGSD